MKNQPFPRRGRLMTWMRLPLELWRIRRQPVADAAEILRYLEGRRTPRMKTRPMQLIIAALRERTAA